MRRRQLIGVVGAVALSGCVDQSLETEQETSDNDEQTDEDEERREARDEVVSDNWEFSVATYRYRPQLLMWDEESETTTDLAPERDQFVSLNLSATNLATTREAPDVLDGIELVGDGASVDPLDELPDPWEWGDVRESGLWETRSAVVDEVEGGDFGVWILTFDAPDGDLALDLSGLEEVSEDRALLEIPIE